MRLYLWSLAGILASYLPLAGGTMSGAIAMGGQLITGLGQAIVAGGALRYEALGAGTLPTTALFSSAQTPTNYTEASFVADDVGVHLVYTGATATSRTAGRMTAGTRIAGLVSGYCLSTGGAVGAATWGVRIQRADGKVITAHFLGASSLFTVYAWTSKDAFLATRLSIGATNDLARPHWIRAGQATPGGNIIVEVSPDGVSWSTLYNDTPTNAFGDAGDVTSVGFGVFATNATLIAAGTLRRCVVTP